MMLELHGDAEELYRKVLAKSQNTMGTERFGTEGATEKLAWPAIKLEKGMEAETLRCQFCRMCLGRTALVHWRPSARRCTCPERNDDSSQVFKKHLTGKARIGHFVIVGRWEACPKHLHSIPHAVWNMTKMKDRRTKDERWKEGGGWGQPARVKLTTTHGVIDARSNQARCCARPLTQKA